jgi:hypothetical protein
MWNPGGQHVDNFPVVLLWITYAGIDMEQVPKLVYFDGHGLDS